MLVDKNFPILGVILKFPDFPSPITQETCSHIVLIRQPRGAFGGLPVTCPHWPWSSPTFSPSFPRSLSSPHPCTLPRNQMRPWVPSSVSPAGCTRFRCYHGATSPLDVLDSHGRSARPLLAHGSQLPLMRATLGTQPSASLS